MKKILAVLVAVATMLTGALVSTTLASAYAPHPYTINDRRFWSGSICVDGSAINGSLYRVAYQAQQWNLRVNNTSVLALDYEDDCAAAGYPPSRRMVVGMYNSSDPDAPCTVLTNDRTDFYDGMYRWTDGPGIYILNSSLCAGSQARRDHIVAASIGIVLGLTVLNSSGYNSRIMNMTTWSWDNVTVPDTASGQLVYSIYTGYYGG